MKKFTREQLLRLDGYRKARWAKRLRRRLGAGAQLRNQIKVFPPKSFSFSKNFDGTVEFLSSLKNEVFSNRNQFRDNHRRRHLFADLSEIRQISVPAAVVLAAELDRWRKKEGIRFRTKRSKNWAARVKCIMSELGIFDHLGVSNFETRQPTEIITISRLETDVKSDGAKIRQILDTIREIVERFSSRPQLYVGLSEAIQNRCRTCPSKGSSTYLSNG